MGPKTIDRKHCLKYVFVILFAAIFLRQFTTIIYRSGPEIRKFLAAKGDYNRLRHSYPTFASTIEAKKIIEPHSPVSISYSSSGIENIAARYGLYPLELTPDGDYLIDLAHNAKSSVFPKKKQLASGVFVYAKENARFLPPKENTYPPLSLTLLIFFASVIFQTIIGMLIMCLLHIPFKKNNMVWMIGTSYLTGFCLLTASVWCALIVGMTLEIKTLMDIGIIVICLLFVLSLRKNADSEKTAPPTSKKTFPERILGIFTFILAAIIALWIISNPIKDWDTMSNWAIKSKVIFHEKSLDLHYTFDHHNSYPILWPLHMAAEFTLLQGDYDEVALLNSALLFLLLLTQLLKGCSLLEAKPFFAYICVLAYVAYFTSENPTISAMPENAFLCFLTGLIVSVCLWLKSPKDKRYLVLSIILAVGLNLIKLEGAVATMIITCSLIIAGKKEVLARTTAPFIGMLLLTTTLPALWIYWTKAQGLSAGVFHLQNSFSLEKLIFLIKLNVKHGIEYGEYLPIFFGLAYFVFFPNSRKWNTSEKFLLSVSIFLMMFKWLATLGWTKEIMLTSGIFHDATWRLFLHTGPGLTLLFCSRAFHRAQV